MKLPPATLKLLLLMTVVINSANYFLYEEWSAVRKTTSDVKGELIRKLKLQAELRSMDPTILSRGQYFPTTVEAQQWLQKNYETEAVVLSFSTTEPGVLTATYSAQSLGGLIKAIEATTMLTNLSIGAVSASLNSPTEINGAIAWQLHDDS